METNFLLEFAAAAAAADCYYLLLKLITSADKCALRLLSSLFR